MGGALERLPTEAEGYRLGRDGSHSREIALRLCTEIREQNRGTWYTAGGMLCRGCVRFSHSDPAKMCFSSRPDNRGCFQVNARYDRLRQEAAASGVSWPAGSPRANTSA